MDSSPDTAAPQPDAAPNPLPPPTAPTRSIAARIVVIAAIVIGVVGIAGMWIKLPYVIFSPGDATPIEGLVDISGTKTYDHDGEVLLLTVRVSNGRPNLWRFLEATWDDDSRVIGEQQYLGNAPRGRVDRASVQMMNESQLAAKEAALTRLGYDVEVTGQGAKVLQVLADSPAERAGMQTGDVIVAIDGRKISTRDQVGQIVQPEPVGTQFAVTVERDGDRRDLTVTSEAATSGELTGKPFFGIGAGTEDLKVHFPFQVSIDAGDVSGPSGGLAFALTIMNDLTPGDLTGGKKIAVTGEIDGAGRVGEVGGVPQKAVAARESGATLMIVPAAEVREARSKAGSMKVVGVRTLDGALRVLRRNGGAPVPAVAGA